MKNSPFIFLFTALCITNVLAQINPDKEDWVQLFNGKNLDGWDIKFTGHTLNDNYLNTFKVEEGVLKVSYDSYTNFDEIFGHIFYNEKFSWYRIIVIYRFTGEQAPDAPGWAYRNNGIMVHSQSAASMGLNQDFPYSIEVQLLGGNGKDKRPTANLCTPGTNVVMNGKLFTPHCVNSDSETYHGDQWVEVSVLVLGDSLVEHLVNGIKVMSYENPQIGGGQVHGYGGAEMIEGTLLSDGFIALQAESHPTEFRKVELLNLSGCMDPKAINYKSYYLKADNTACKYPKNE